jgi:signal transduction histidine kinase
MNAAERRLAWVQAVMVALAFAGGVLILGAAHPSTATTVSIIGLGACSAFFRVRLRDFAISSASLAVIVAAVLGTPMLAVSVGGGAVLFESLRSRIEPKHVLTNVWVYSLLGLVAGGAMELVRPVAESYSGGLALSAFVGSILGDFFTLVLTAIQLRTELGIRLRETTRGAVAPIVPWLFLMATLAATAILAQEALGAAGIWLTCLVLLAHKLTVQRLVRDEERGRALEALELAADRRAAEVARLAADRQRLVHLMLEAEEDERRRTSELLHDHVLQELILARQAITEMAVAPDGELERAADAIERSIQALRGSLVQLSPVVFERIGLQAALQAVGLQAAGARDIDLSVDVEPWDGGVDERLVFTIARELLINAIRHGRARAVSVHMAPHGGELVLDVIDDGHGMDESRLRGAVEAGHVGLAMCMQRATSADGHLELRTREGGGTAVRVSLPLARYSSADPVLPLAQTGRLTRT